MCTDGAHVGGSDLSICGVDSPTATSGVVGPGLAGSTAGCMNFLFLGMLGSQPDLDLVGSWVLVGGCPSDDHSASLAVLDPTVCKLTGSAEALVVAVLCSHSTQPVVASPGS